MLPKSARFILFLVALSFPNSEETQEHTRKQYTETQVLGHFDVLSIRFHELLSLGQYCWRSKYGRHWPHTTYYEPTMLHVLHDCKRAALVSMFATSAAAGTGPSAVSALRVSLIPPAAPAMSSIRACWLSRGSRSAVTFAHCPAASEAAVTHAWTFPGACAS